jgi:hypothetical protein
LRFLSMLSSYSIAFLTSMCYILLGTLKTEAGTGSLAKGQREKHSRVAPRVPCCLQRYEGTNAMRASALGSVAFSQETAQEKPLTPLATERVSKDAGVGTPQDAENRNCGPFIPFGKAWEYQRVWHRPGENKHGWMLSLSYSSSITMRTESEPRSIAQRIAYRGVAEGAVGF